MDNKKNVIYPVLVRAAMERRFVRYGEIAPLVGIDLSHQSGPGEIGRLLGEISEDEHRVGRPLLSSIVVRAGFGQGQGTPGSGYYKMAREQRVLNSGEDEEAFWMREVERIFAFWST